MIISLEYEGVGYTCDLSQPIDISIRAGDVRCFYSTYFTKKPYESGAFVGSVKKGAPVNFYDVEINPHGNGTHTESLGHITRKQESIQDTLHEYHFVARLVSVPVRKSGNGDQVITKVDLKSKLRDEPCEAIVIRTRPNRKNKLTKDYSGTNPPYIEKEAMEYLVSLGVKHLLVDLPSVDREVDDGILAGHHIFWNVEGHKASRKSRKDCTITELIFVPNEVKDGQYLLNIQIPNIDLDAVPSKPVLYTLTSK